jgi:hypothetical protein
MDLYRIGNKVLNLDRLNGIIDVASPAGATPTDGGTALHVLFDQGEIELTGREAEAFRRWYRHASRPLDLHRDENGEELVSPEEQVRGVVEVLIERLDRLRLGDPAFRHVAHRARAIIGHFLTGELKPARSRDFQALLQAARHGE